MSDDIRAQVCAKHGLPDRELVDVQDTPGGLTFGTSDGNWFIDVPADLPDFAGKTGLMFLHAPNVDGRPYTGDFPVYVSWPVEAVADGVDDGEGLIDMSTLTKPQLIAHGAALDPPVVVDPKLNKTDMLTVLADAAAAVEAVADGVDDGDPADDGNDNDPAGSGDGGDGS